jgi:hypothetical protein
MLDMRCGKKRAASRSERVRFQLSIKFNTLRRLAYSLCTPGGFHLRYCVSPCAGLHNTWVWVCGPLRAYPCPAIPACPGRRAERV